VEYIINAKKFFPDITIHKLTVNYRSHKEIISISDKFIRLNKFRTSKKIRSHNGKGGIVRYRESADMHEEAEHIAGIICSSSQGLSAAVLYRNNYQGTFLKQKFEASASGRTVEFMTMHGSKGLEFDIVIIAGISDKIIPDRTTDIEEERRLFYVALTRAKKELHLLYHKNSRGELPRFIKETGYKSS
jgi:superfamily I DNA/RNA helicase